jgi:hypothetical protein
LSNVPTSAPAVQGAAASAGEREARLTALLVLGAMIVGALVQIVVPPGPLTLVAATGIASLVVLGLSFVVPGRLRTTLAGFVHDLTRSLDHDPDRHPRRHPHPACPEPEPARHQSCAEAIA